MCRIKVSHWAMFRVWFGKTGERGLLGLYTNGQATAKYHAQSRSGLTSARSVSPLHSHRLWVSFVRTDRITYWGSVFTESSGHNRALIMCAFLESQMAILTPTQSQVLTSLFASIPPFYMHYPTFISTHIPFPDPPPTRDKYSRLSEWPCEFITGDSRPPTVPLY